MADDRRLAVHHIGGRAGSRGFPILKAFEKDIVNVLYDADADCIDQIRERNAEFSSELHVLPYCLGETASEGVINISYDPYTSSLFELDPAYGSHYSISAGGDYPLSEACKIVEKRRVKIVTVDAIFQSKDMTAPLPDFLSIDTEGYEYEILSGAAQTLRSNVLGVILEADLHPAFKGQKIFGDNVRLLSEAGFDFARFQHLHEMFQFRVPLGLRGEGVHGTSDALFLRKLDTLDGMGPDKQRNMLGKLAFIAIVFKQVDYAVECLRRRKALGAGPAEDGDVAYLRFLRELERTIEQMPQHYPPTFAETYTTFAASKARFEKQADVQKRQERENPTLREMLKRIVKTMPAVYTLLRWAMQTASAFKVRLVYSKKRLFAGDSSIERLLRSYGLAEQADVIREKRLYQS